MKYKLSITICMIFVLISITGFIPPTIAGRQGGGIRKPIVYPHQYINYGRIISDDIDHFRSNDDQIIRWYDGWALDTTIWFLRPSRGAKEGNSVQMELNFSASGPYVLNMRIYYYEGYSELWIYTGPENKWTKALVPIPNDNVIIINLPNFRGIKYSTLLCTLRASNTPINSKPAKNNIKAIQSNVPRKSIKILLFKTPGYCG